ncbi:MAG: DNA alkylation repair protein [Candidatus Neomarinimicrobiota bacterium]|nr:MAG: DNA alkylation repair protein [Candidatus Neomarinimicrobiota bacterium]
MSAINRLREQLRDLADPVRAQNLARFFQTGPGQYGEGDRFYGIRVPHLRQVAGRTELPTLDEAEHLLQSPIHEERFVALLLLIRLYRRKNPDLRAQVYRLYLRNTRFINNWDLVDTSAEHIVGAWLWDKDRSPLSDLARSPLLWERRIAVLATFHFIKKGDFSTTLALAGQLVHDPEDLIHKAVGWMLREIGNRHRPTEEEFLRAHYRDMPRTALRYAIEKFPEPLRQAYLRGRI